jgi:phenylalanyl-tRNA synthetase beta chain
MIVTRSWLSEFVDLDGIEDQKLYQTFNAIGLEVDSLKRIEIPAKVVVGRILSCKKHPNADKLNVCQIDVGHGGTRQIVCGAANVVGAEYVAVAMIGAHLPGDMQIKFAKLRGVESEGMVCSATELGLPEVDEGILILDESIGKLEVGRELCEYENISDTVIELELTANRGDCLGVLGVARDLSVALKRELKPIQEPLHSREKLGIARFADIHVLGEINAGLAYTLIRLEDDLRVSMLVKLRLAMVGLETQEPLQKLVEYALHATGVILRTYDGARLQNEDEKIHLEVRSDRPNCVEVRALDHTLSTVGISQDPGTMATVSSELVLLEGSYMNPDALTQAVVEHDLKTDAHYYKSSRGSMPDLDGGMHYFVGILASCVACKQYEGWLNTYVKWEPTSLAISSEEISSIIGQTIEKGTIITILQSLGFELSSAGEHIGAIAPRFRHDIRNIHDIAEEILRIVGIDQITSRPLRFGEANRLNDVTEHIRAKRALRHRAVGCGFYENVSYLFSDKEQIERYGFGDLTEGLGLANPIVEELNTLRSTLIINLLLAVKRNISYASRSVPLFEIGSIYDKHRNEREVLCIVYSGHDGSENISNHGKPPLIDFASFVRKVGGVVGPVSLEPCSASNDLIHPYQSADILIGGERCGYLSKLHPTAQEHYDIQVTYFAEIALEPLMPKHVNVVPVSRFQGAYKDLSLVIDQSIGFYEIATHLRGLLIPQLKACYPVDIYQDEQLGDQKSLTIRLHVQSMEKTLEDQEIDEVVERVLLLLEKQCGAVLR